MSGLGARETPSEREAQAQEEIDRAVEEALEFEFASLEELKAAFRR